MVMVWLEGGQGEVRGACAPHPQHLGGRVYVATLPTCGPLLILFLRFEAVGTPQAAGVM